MKLEADGELFLNEMTIKANGVDLLDALVEHLLKDEFGSTRLFGHISIEIIPANAVYLVDGKPHEAKPKMAPKHDSLRP